MTTGLSYVVPRSMAIFLGQRTRTARAALVLDQVDAVLLFGDRTRRRRAAAGPAFQVETRVDAAHVGAEVVTRDCVSDDIVVSQQAGRLEARRRRELVRVSAASVIGAPDRARGAPGCLG